MSVRAVSAAAMLAVGGWLCSSADVWAATGSCAGTSPITVSTALTSECRINGADVLTVTTSGSVITTGAYAVYGGSSVTNGSIDNAGTLEADTSGIRTNDAVITTLNNSGTIRATSSTFGTGIYNNGTIGTLTNSGTISSPNIGLYVNSSGSLGTLNNTGTIRGGSMAIYSPTLTTLNNWGTIEGGTIAIYAPGLATLNNSGVLQGSVTLGNTTFNLSGTTARVGGDTANIGGSVNLLGGADFTTEGWFDAANINIANGAHLRIGASAHYLRATSSGAAAISNAGTLHVAEGRVADVRGNYTQSGALRIGASSNISYGRLTVTGNAVLTPSATIDVDVNTTHTLANNQTLVGVITTGGTLTNNASTGYVSDNSALFDFEPTTHAKSVDLRVVAAGAPPAPAPSPAPAPKPVNPAPAPVPPPAPQRGIVPAVQQSGLLNGIGAATVLDGFIRGGHSGSDWDAVVTALGRLPTNEAVAVATGQTMPILHGNAALAGVLPTSMASEAVTRRLAESGTTAATTGEGADRSDRMLWVEPLSQWFDQDSMNGASGFKSTAHGLVLGTQADVNVATALGLALAYVDSNVEGKQFASAHAVDIETLQLTGYGQHALGESPWRLTWQAGVARSRYDSKRTLGFIGRTARAHFNATGWQLGMGVNRTYRHGATVFRPEASLTWREIQTNGYVETGANALNLRVGAQAFRETRMRLGLQALHQVNPQWQWLTQAALSHQLQRSTPSVTAAFSGGGATFSTASEPGSRTMAELGIGVRYQPSKAFEVTARYGTALNSNRKAQTAAIQASWLF